MKSAADPAGVGAAGTWSRGAADPAGVVAIVGVGLIGGSVGLALRRTGLAREVIGVGRNPARLKLAQKMGAIDRWSTDPAAAAAADLVVLCTPVKRIYRDVLAILPYATRPIVFTDAGSTKTFLVKKIASRLKIETRRHGLSHAYVGAHPMAGSEKAGVERADDRLFENAAVILTPTPGTPPPAVRRVESFWRGLGGKTIHLTPGEHDQACALVSHLPHLVATALVNTLASGVPRGRSHVFYGLCAGGFRDTTRIAEADPNLWWEIFDTNARELRRAASLFQKHLSSAASAIRSGRSAPVKSAIIRAARLRRQIPKIGRGLLRAAYDLIVNVPDKPGMIARVASPLARRSVNIADIEVLHVREGEEGNLRLAFRSLSDRQAAARYLRKASLTVVIR
ncbi:prephenate dehydrogenase/arogenate dehydrogenase family protein [bacterium]|nr:prephenate dehydrogenase/arogenate dehydrogenase family protein [bacterium]